MKKNGTSVFENGLIWFGAAVSIAEIVTGTYFAPLGFAKGAVAIILGHCIGCGLLFFAGLIGGRTRQSAMETVQLSFGQKGGLFFAFLNVVQLIGWTGIMIFDGATAANEAWGIGFWVWSLLIGSLIFVWVMIGLQNLGWLNRIAVVALIGLSLMLTWVVLRGGVITRVGTDQMSFGAAIELSIAMPLSWLPLMSDYTREAQKPMQATLFSVVVYGVVSSWMYMIGMGTALYTGTTDIALLMVKAGLGVAALLIVILSTVTTTFLDVYSAGISSEVLALKVKGKWISVVTIMIGVALAIFFPLNDITNFLYLIGSVFAPMISVQIVDYYIFERYRQPQSFVWLNLAFWLIGFILYRKLLSLDWIVGATLPAMAVTMVLTWIGRKMLLNQS